MLRMGKKWLFFLLFFGCIIHDSKGLSEDDPLLLDRFLHVIWEPSGLVRLWTAADQLYNIASSWGGVARTLITLPFKEARGERSHIMIKGYNGPGNRLGGDSIASHRERFAKVYSEPPEFTFAEQNSLPGGKDHNYVAASSNGNSPLVAFPGAQSSGSLSQDNFGMSSAFGTTFPLLGKYLSGSPETSSQLGDPSIFQKRPFDYLLKNDENIASFSDLHSQPLWSNKYAEGNTVFDGNPDGAPMGIPYGISKALGNFFTSLPKGNTLRNVFSPQPSVNFPFLVNTVFPEFHQTDSLKEGKGVSGLSLVDRHHKNSKIRKIEGSLESSGNHLHHSNYHQEIKSPKSVVESLFGNADPQVRLQMTLRLLKELGRSHLSRIETLEHREQ